MQYRGLFGPRLNVTLDGAYVNSGGPNWMDPPLHYLPATLMAQIEVTPGVASVSEGAGIGGRVAASYKTSQFADGSDFKFSGDLRAISHSVDNGYNAGGILSLANDTHRLHILGNQDEGDDQEFDGGEIASTNYQRAFVGFGYGLRLGDQEFSIDYRRGNTDRAGTPVLPLDIDFFDSNFVNLGYRGNWGDYKINAGANVSNINHGMTNFNLRQAPDISQLPLPPFVGDDKRSVDANGDGKGFFLNAARDVAGGELRFGLNWRDTRNDATVFDPDVPVFFIQNFNDVTSETTGIFAEWEGKLTDVFGLELGVGLQRVETDADEVDAQPANLPLAQTPGTPPFAVRVLRDRFNASDRSQTDNNVDWVARFTFDQSDSSRFEVALAQKTRSPGYVERYLWIPLEINSGLGDGNNYVSNPELDPEESLQLELGWIYNGENSYFRPRAYYRNIDDYIQGVPTLDPVVRAVSGGANGDPNPLIFANVDAKLYGVDAAYGFRINESWQVDGVISYVRGKRRDISDDLYRIAPLNTRLSLTYATDGFSATVEGVAYAEQDKISDTIISNSIFQNADPTPGYGLLNLNATYQTSVTGLRLNGGINNVLDKEYTDHLTGFNRVQNSDVPQGERLPGAGRNVYVSLGYRF